jgi:hypothetical protein
LGNLPEVRALPFVGRKGKRAWRAGGWVTYVAFNPLGEC